MNDMPKVTHQPTIARFALGYVVAAQAHFQALPHGGA